jgi:hypothetical protein
VIKRIKTKTINVPGRNGEDIKRAKLVIKLERGPDFEQSMADFEKMRQDNAEKAAAKAKEEESAKEEEAAKEGEKTEEATS